MRYVIVKDNIVVNTVLYDGLTPFEVDGEMIESDTADIGWSYDGSNFSNPNALTEEQIALQKAEEYKIYRSLEYPSIGDQLDALFHAGLFPADMASKIQAIKDKYPKE